MMSRRWLVLVIAATVVLLLTGRVLSAWYVDYQWFAIQGATRLWWVRATDLGLLRGGVFVAVSTFAFANLFAVRRTASSIAFSISRRWMVRRSPNSRA